MIGRYTYRREPAPVEETNAWPKFAEQTYTGPCPADKSHDAEFVGRGYSRNGESYETRTVVSVDCRTCPPVVTP